MVQALHSCMVLDTLSRGHLEQIIDMTAANLPLMVRFYRQPAIKESMHIDNESDFLLGWALGNILSKFQSDFIFYKQRVPSLDESKEIGDITYKRAAELRDAIFREG